MSSDNAASQIAKQDSWRNVRPLPAQRRRLTFRKEFSQEDYHRIILGLIPKVMEDKWFIYFDEGWLHFHRSWTGFCIYQCEFAKEGNKYVLVDAWANRDKEQYTGTDDQQDMALILSLIENLLLKN
jgi:hypothetical protein